MLTQTRPRKRLFIIIQPLQYLQALELLNEADENVLIALWADADSQLHNLVQAENWNHIHWIAYPGRATDILKHRNAIRKLLSEMADIDDLIVSAFYNPFMNLFANACDHTETILLEDGIANIIMDNVKSPYETSKFAIQHILCRLAGFDIQPIDNVTVFTLFPPDTDKIPRIANRVIQNDFAKLRAEIASFPADNSVYFVSSAYVDRGMIEREDYVEFLRLVAERHRESGLKILLHRHETSSDYTELQELPYVEIVESSGPVELYFKGNGVRPGRVCSAGSGATETLRIIYGIDIDVFLPRMERFHDKYRQHMNVVYEHFGASHSVTYI